MSEHNDRYGWSHRRLRARVAGVVAAGRAACARCGQPIDSREPWDLDHADDDPTRYIGPSHRRCNRGTAGNGLANAGRSVGIERKPAPVAAETWTTEYDDEGTPWKVAVPWRPGWSRHWAGKFNPTCGCDSCRAHYGRSPAEDRTNHEGNPR